MMRLLLLFIIFIFSGCSENSAPVTDIVVLNEVIDLGNVPKSDIQVASFKIHNVGSFPLIIKDVTTDCQCTLVSWSKEKVIPSDTAIIKVSYDNVNYGKYQKLVYLSGNIKKPVTLILRGKVI